MTRIGSPVAPDDQSTPERHDLQAGGVSAAGSIVMAVAGSAPAYSIAAATATLVGVAGLGAPAALLWCGDVDLRSPKQVETLPDPNTSVIRTVDDE